MKFLFNFARLILFISALNIASFAQTTFTNSTAITIKDATANAASVADPYPSTINVAGLTGTIATAPGSVKVRFNNLTHPYPADIAITLVGPTGEALLLQDSAGDELLTGITYTLSDDAVDKLPFEGSWKDGAYKPTAYFSSIFPAPGPGGEYRTPADEGSSTFSSTFGGTNPNGVWKLFVGDFYADDAGSIAGGWSLTITTAGKSNTVVNNANVDMNGDGKTDFLVTRETSKPFGEASESNFPGFRRPRSVRERKRLQKAANAAEVGLQRYWYVNNNGTNSYDVVPFGAVGDTEVPEDYDGDGKDDIAVWREGAPDEAAFYILQSSTKTFRVERFGQTGDDPTVSGDYDGDKIADVATFRCPEITAGQCFFFYRASSNNPKRGITYVPFGFGKDSDYYPNPGDFDGDGKADFMVVRPINGRLGWFLRTRAGGGSGATPTVWGLEDDYMTPGDYDGDGKTDIAVWRPDPDSTKNFYYILRSSNQIYQSVEWGMDFDFPAQSWNVH